MESIQTQEQIQEEIFNQAGMEMQERADLIEAASLFTDPFMVQRRRLNNLFGEEYVTQHPVLIAAAVVEQELTAVRLEMAQLQTAIQEIKQ